MAKKEDTIAKIPAMRKASAWLLADPSRTVKEALTRFELQGTYSNFWLLHRRAELTLAGHKFKAEPLKSEVVDLRDKQNLSWGEIAARFGDAATHPFGIPEARIRRLYTEQSGKHHEGTRIGHGGRFLGGPNYAEALYRGETHNGELRQQVGTSATVSEKWELVVAAILAERDAETKVKRAATSNEKAKAHTDLAKKQAATKQAVKAHAAASAAEPAAPAKRKPRKIAA